MRRSAASALVMRAMPWLDTGRGSSEDGPVQVDGGVGVTSAQAAERRILDPSSGARSLRRRLRAAARAAVTWRVQTERRTRPKCRSGAV